MEDGSSGLVESIPFKLSILNECGYQYQPVAFDYHRKLDFLAVSTSDLFVLYHLVDHGSPRHINSYENSDICSLLRIQPSFDSLKFLSCQGSKVYLWDPVHTTKNIMYSVNINQRAFDIQWNPIDENIFSVSTVNGFIGLYDVRQKPEATHKFLIDGRCGKTAWSPAWSPSPSSKLTINVEQKYLIFWDVRKISSNFVEENNDLEKTCYDVLEIDDGISDFIWPNNHSIADDNNSNIPSPIILSKTKKLLFNECGKRKPNLFALDDRPPIDFSLPLSNSIISKIITTSDHDDILIYHRDREIQSAKLLAADLKNQVQLPLVNNSIITPILGSFWRNNYHQRKEFFSLHTDGTVYIHNYDCLPKESSNNEKTETTGKSNIKLVHSLSGSSLTFLAGETTRNSRTKRKPIVHQLKNSLLDKFDPIHPNTSFGIDIDSAGNSSKTNPTLRTSSKHSSQQPVVGPMTFDTLINVEILLFERQRDCNESIEGVRISQVDRFTRQLELECLIPTNDKISYGNNKNYYRALETEIFYNENHNPLTPSNNLNFINNPYDVKNRIISLTLTFPVRKANFWLVKFSLENKSTYEMGLASFTGPFLTELQSITEAYHKIMFKKNSDLAQSNSRYDFNEGILAVIGKHFKKRVIQQREKMMNDNESGANSFKQSFEAGKSLLTGPTTAEDSLTSRTETVQVFTIEREQVVALKTPFPCISGGVFNSKGDLVLFGNAKVHWSTTNSQPSETTSDSTNSPTVIQAESKMVSLVLPEAFPTDSSLREFRLIRFDGDITCTEHKSYAHLFFASFLAKKIRDEKAIATKRNSKTMLVTLDNNNPTEGKDKHKNNHHDEHGEGHTFLHEEYDDDDDDDDDDNDQEDEHSNHDTESDLDIPIEMKLMKSFKKEENSKDFDEKFDEEYNFAFEIDLDESNQTVADTDEQSGHQETKSSTRSSPTRTKRKNQPHEKQTVKKVEKSQKSTQKRRRSSGIVDDSNDDDDDDGDEGFDNLRFSTRSRDIPLKGGSCSAPNTPPVQGNLYRSKNSFYMHSDYESDQESEQSVANLVKQKVDTCEKVVIFKCQYLTEMSLVDHLRLGPIYYPRDSAEFRTERVELCHQNTKIMQEILPTMTGLVQFWSLLGVCLNVHTIVDSGGLIDWNHSAIGRGLFRKLVGYLMTLNDLVLWGTVITIVGGSKNFIELFHGQLLTETKANQHIINHTFVEHILYDYIRVLRQWGYSIKATEVGKFMTDANELLQLQQEDYWFTNENTILCVDVRCAECNSDLSSVTNPLSVEMSVTRNLCPTCQTSTSSICVVCLETVNGLYSICELCGHGGHRHHLLQWFTRYDECASGCKCKCKFGMLDEQVNDQFSSNNFPYYYTKQINHKSRVNSSLQLDKLSSGAGGSNSNLAEEPRKARTSIDSLSGPDYLRKLLLENYTNDLFPYEEDSNASEAGSDDDYDELSRDEDDYENSKFTGGGYYDFGLPYHLFSNNDT